MLSMNYGDTTANSTAQHDWLFLLPPLSRKSLLLVLVRVAGSGSVRLRGGKGRCEFQETQLTRHVDDWRESGGSKRIVPFSTSALISGCESTMCEYHQAANARSRRILTSPFVVKKGPFTSTSTVSKLTALTIALTTQPLPTRRTSSASTKPETSARRTAATRQDSGRTYPSVGDDCANVPSRAHTRPSRH